MSLLGKLRHDLALAEGRVTRWERKLAQLRERYIQEAADRRTETTRAGQAAHLALDGAKQARALAFDALQAEELRLLDPTAKLRFG